MHKFSELDLECAENWSDIRSDTDDEVATFILHVCDFLTVLLKAMEYYDDGAYERISKSIAESRRGAWMPPRRRNRIKRKVIASCLVTLLGICCCTYCSVDPAGPVEFDDEPVIAKDTFVNINFQ